MIRYSDFSTLNQTDNALKGFGHEISRNLVFLVYSKGHPAAATYLCASMYTLSKAFIRD